VLDELFKGRHFLAEVIVVSALVPRSLSIGMLALSSKRSRLRRTSRLRGSSRRLATSLMSAACSLPNRKTEQHDNENIDRRVQP
jgi:hypothetical protein